jgi:alkylated DNA repair dioxygenase AlkB
MHAFFKAKPKNNDVTKDAAARPFRLVLRTVFELPNVQARLRTCDLRQISEMVRAAVASAKHLFKLRSIQMRGTTVVQKRQTCFMGLPGVPGFCYSGQTTAALAMTAPVHALLQMVNDQMGTDFNGALLNYYEATPTSAIGFHSDAYTGLGRGGTVVSISFGGARTFRLKDKGTRQTVFDLRTGPCELMAMEGRDFQRRLVHGIPPMAKPQPRWSITFRTHVRDA